MAGSFEKIGAQVQLMKLYRKNIETNLKNMERAELLIEKEIEKLKSGSKKQPLVVDLTATDDSEMEVTKRKKCTPKRRIVPCGGACSNARCLSCNRMGMNSPCSSPKIMDEDYEMVDASNARTITNAQSQTSSGSSSGGSWGMFSIPSIDFGSAMDVDTDFLTNAL